MTLIDPTQSPPATAASSNATGDGIIIEFLQRW